jgi:hypothetical protein
VFACYAVLLIYNVTRPPLVNPDRQLGALLEAHHLRYGLSTTWLASSGISVDTQNRVQVGEVKLAGGAPARRTWNTKDSWYDPRLHDARFLIEGCDPCRTANLFRVFGRPAKAYVLGGFTVFVWDKNLLSPPAPGP